MKLPLGSALTTNGRESWQLALFKDSYFGYLSENIKPSRLVDPVGRAVLLLLTGVTWKIGGTTKTSTKLEKK